VSDHDRRERELQRYKAVVETINDGIYVKDEDNRFTLVTRPTRRCSATRPRNSSGATPRFSSATR
jgi:hypothetical protein